MAQEKKYRFPRVQTVLVYIGLVMMFAVVLWKTTFASVTPYTTIGQNLLTTGTFQVGETTATSASAKMTRTSLGTTATEHTFVPTQNSPTFQKMWGGYWTSERQGVVELANAFYQLVIPSLGQMTWGYIANTGSFAASSLVDLVTFDNDGAVRLNGNFAREVSVSPPTSENTNGSNLTVAAGTASTGASDKNGGDLYLASGGGFGTGSANIYLQTANGGASGPNARPAATAVTILGNGKTGIGTTTPAEKLQVTGNIQLGDSSVTSVGQKLMRTAAGTNATEHVFIPTQNSPTFSHLWGGVWTSERTGTTETANAFYQLTIPAGNSLSWGTVSTTGSFTNSNLVDHLSIESGYVRFSKTSTGAPTAGDCDNDAERGRLVIDTSNNRLYICNGASRAWDYVGLTE